ncbi:acyltransferase family protein [Catenovulum sediminis]|uniref:Acyltransferase family protein n=1 Tax=Catenovulum sediminis TaxID=1740262 RepID=A0ABV1RF76_9ALTE
MRYRKDIDGLRAVAILPVIWVHSGLPFLSGGFLGVDVFFVISGFLITSILLKEFSTDSFSLTKFYERRARRILPALLTVIVFTSIAVPLVTNHPKYLADYGNSVLSTLLFSSNIYFWQTSGYFGSASEMSPMLHTWSLAVEEQFYIFFPLLLMMLFSRGKKVLVTLLIIISAISLLISEWGAVNSPIGNFYLLPTRAWELLAGALASILYLNVHIENIRGKHSGLLSIIGFVAIIVSYLYFSPSTLHPSFLTVVPVIGTVLVLLFCKSENIIGRLLSTKVFIFIGLISYSLYLWHQPILALMKNYSSVHLKPEYILLSIGLTFLLSFFTWKYVELPFRDRKKISQERLWRLSLSFTLIVVFVGGGFRGNFVLQKFVSPEDMVRYERLLEADRAHSSQAMHDDGVCKFWSPELDDSFVARFNECEKKYDKAIFILGGSHGMDLYNAISLNTESPFVVSVSKGFCRAHSFIGDHQKQTKCQYSAFLTFANKYSDSISYVVYTQTPDRLFKANSIYEAKESDLSLDHVGEVVDYLAKVKEKYALNVLMIGMLPPLARSPINWNFKESFLNQYDDIVSPQFVELARKVDGEFEKRLSHYDIPYISKIDGFALEFPRDLIYKGKITYSDNRHISTTGELLFGERLIKRMWQLGYNQFVPKQ